MHEPVYICESDQVVEGGKGIRFPVVAFGDAATGFVVRYEGQLRAYLNRCAHVPIELDWNEGEFFESSGLYIMCSTHGAIYVPESGYCAGGPCKGGRLKAIDVHENGGRVYWQPTDAIYSTERSPL